METNSKNVNVQNSTLNFNFDLKENQKNIIIFIHLSCLFFSILVPLVCWMFTKDKASAIYKESVKALNFALSMFILGVCSALQNYLALGDLLTVGLAVISIGLVLKAAYDTYHERETDYRVFYPFIKNN